MDYKWLALCRPGFENELSAEAKELGATTEYTQGSGYVLFELSSKGFTPKPWRLLELKDFIFARQLFMVAARLDLNNEADPIAAIVSKVRQVVKNHHTIKALEAIVAETPDTENMRSVLSEAQLVAQQIADRLGRFGVRFIPGRGAPRLHLFFENDAQAIVGLSSPQLSSPWPMGAARIKLPSEAPSRSARKLEEALSLFISPDEIYTRLKPGMKAVDLGAAPGGWSWTLANRGLVVTAVDNGKLTPEALKTGLVTHLEVDGFTYRPEKRVDWMVCDIVAGGPRVAKLVANWIRRGMCGETIFNLKLGSPAGRLAEVRRAQTLLLKTAKEASVHISLVFKHLYHDREEITGHICLLGKIEKPRIPAKATPRKRVRPAPKSARSAPKTSARRNRQRTKK